MKNVLFCGEQKLPVLTKHSGTQTDAVFREYIETARDQEEKLAGKLSLSKQ